MRETSNPVFRSLPKQQGGYASFGSGAAGAATAQVHQGYQPYTDQQQQRGVSRPMTIDDVVTKTGMTLGLLSVVAVISYFLVAGANAGALIGQAILGTIGVFFGMLVVYKTGAIRVTPKLTRMVVAGMIGVLVLMLGNFVLAMFNVGGGEGLGLRSGGPLAIIFSLVCIGLAAFSFLLDFDSADQMIRAGAPEKAAWGVALGLTVTLVWLYVEILRLLSYFQND